MAKTFRGENASGCGAGILQMHSAWHSAAKTHSLRTESVQTGLKLLSACLV